jgi:hypothetical protein
LDLIANGIVGRHKNQVKAFEAALEMEKLGLMLKSWKLLKF